MALRVSMRGLHVGRCHVSLKQLVVLWLVAMLVSACCFLAMDHRPPGCRQQEMLQYVCGFYSKGIITGKMCPRLCNKKEFTFTKCLSRSPDHQIYEVEVPGKKPRTKDRYLVHWTRDPNNGDYHRPKEGSSMEDLRHMLSAFLKLRLGEREYSDLQTQILNVADVNNDGKVSLAEAKTLWALLHANDFLIMMALSKSEMIPKLEGFCGDLFVTEGMQSYNLHPLLSPLHGLFGNLFQPGLLDWSKRARVALGVVEFVEEIIDNPAGNFLMCSVTPLSIGYTSGHDAKLLDLEHLSPEVIVEGHLQERDCRADEDCMYGLSCQTKCSAVHHKCAGEVTYPNLYKMCKLLRPLLLQGVPQEIEDKLKVTFDRCMELRHSGRKMDMEHSLVINDMKGIIWRQISNSKS